MTKNIPRATNGREKNIGIDKFAQTKTPLYLREAFVFTSSTASSDRTTHPLPHCTSGAVLRQHPTCLDGGGSLVLTAQHPSDSATTAQQQVELPIRLQSLVVILLQPFQKYKLRLCIGTCPKGSFFASIPKIGRITALGLSSTFSYWTVHAIIPDI